MTTYRHLCNLYKTILNRRRVEPQGAVGSKVLSSKRKFFNRVWYVICGSWNLDGWFVWFVHIVDVTIATISFNKRERSRNPNIIWHLSQPIGWIWLVVSSGFAKVIFVFWTALLPRAFILPANLPALAYLLFGLHMALVCAWRAVAAPAPSLACPKLG